MEILDWLDSLGVELGFTPARGYISPLDGSLADSAWLINPAQPPLAVFLAASRELAFQWLGSSTEPHAWLVVAFTEGSVHEYGGESRIRAYTMYSEESRSRVRVDAFEVAAAIQRLLQIGGDARMGSAREWPRGRPSRRIRYGGPAARIEVEEESLACFSAWSSEDEDTGSLAASRKVVPASLLSGGELLFDSAMLRLVERSGGRILVSSEHRNLPFTFRLTLDPKEGDSLDLWFDADKSNLAQALLFQSILERIESSRGFRVVDPSGNSLARIILT